MVKGRIPLDLGTLQQTLLLPVWGRARFARLSPVFRDPAAHAVLEAIDFDFRRVEAGLGLYGVLAFGERARRIDEIIRGFLACHPDGILLNLGAGLDALLERVDNGRCTCLSVDMPDAIGLRRRLFVETDRDRCLAGSILDRAWLDEVPRDRAVMAVLAGVAMYLTDGEARRVLEMLGGLGAGTEVVFDAYSPIAVRLTNRQIRRARLPDAPVRWGLTGQSTLRRWLPGIEIVAVSPVPGRLELTCPVDGYTRLQLLAARLLRFSRLWHLRVAARPDPAPGSVPVLWSWKS